MQQFKIGGAISICGHWKHVRDHIFEFLENLLGPILFIDTINCIDPYRIRQDIYCARIERAYDLWARLLSCERFIETKQINVLIISSLSFLFNDLSKEEAPFLLDHIISRIRYLTERYNLVTLIGNSPFRDDKGASMLLANKIKDRVIV